jgi:hypothetical protein
MSYHFIHYQTHQNCTERKASAIGDTVAHFHATVDVFHKSYLAGCAAGQERLARRFLIAGLRVATLELVGAIVLARPCATFDWTLTLAWSNFERARRRYLAAVPATLRPDALRPVA